VTAWDESNKSPAGLTSQGEPVSRRVRVTVRYRFSPGVFGVDWTLSSVCEVPMAS
jgi:hypothetical protein